MKRTLLEELDAFNRFEKFCNLPANKPLWQGLLLYSNGMAALDLKIQAIYATDAQQEENNKGVTRTKKQVKTDMSNVASSTAACLQAFASVNNDQNLYSQMQIEFSDIMKAKDGKAIGKCDLILEKALALPLDQIELVGISQLVLDTLDQSIKDYKAVASSTGTVRTNKKGLTSNLTTLTGEANKIMRTQLLKMGKQWKISHPDFYNGMVDSAKVIHVNIHTKARISVKDENDMAVENASIVITSADGRKLTGKTNAKGNCTISRVPEGSASMTISKPDFSEKTLDGLNFLRGKSLTRAITLLPEFDVPAVKEQKKKVSGN
ncbi:MAG: carboxypeptidase-like regulatory domain-containing protein [Bacteroidota bacterium]